MATLTVTARLADCLLLSSRTPASSVRPLLPPGLHPVSRGPWAFWNVAVARFEAMRPSRAQPRFGRTYHQVAYRLHVRAVTEDLSDRRGLYCVHSDVDDTLVHRVGGHLYDLATHRSQIDLAGDAGGLAAWIVSADGRSDAEIIAGTDPPQRRIDSCFASIESARQYLTQPRLSLATSRDGRWLKTAEADWPREQWREAAVEVPQLQLKLFEHLGQDEAELELATRVEPIRITWTIGHRHRLAKWAQRSQPMGQFQLQIGV